MNKTILIAVVAALGLAMTAGPGAATHCNGNIYAISAGAETIYIDDRADDPNAPPGSGFVFGPGGTWIYLESNSVEGLQSGGTAPYPENPAIYGEDDCNHSNPDTIIF